MERLVGCGLLFSLLLGAAWFFYSRYLVARSPKELNYLAQYLHDLKKHQAFLNKREVGWAAQCCELPMPAPWRTDLCWRGAPDWVMEELWNHQVFMFGGKKKWIFSFIRSCLGSAKGVP